MRGLDLRRLGRKQAGNHKALLSGARPIEIQRCLHQAQMVIGDRYAPFDHVG